MIQKHFQEREALVQKALRAAEVHKRKIASHLAKIVKTFWSNVEKVSPFFLFCTCCRISFVPAKIN